MLENKLAYDLAMRYAQTCLDVEFRSGADITMWNAMDKFQQLFNDAYVHYAYDNEVKFPAYPDEFMPGSVR